MSDLAARLNRSSLLLGTIAWLSLWWSPLITIIPHFLLLAILVVVPLALWLIAQMASSRTLQVAQIAQPIAALLATASFLLETGWLAGGLAAAWLAFTGLVALAGWLRLWAHRLTSAAEMCVTAGMLYLPVGGVWLAASRLGLSLLGFGEPLVSLTAMHFHYAGFAALVIAGLTGRQLAALPAPPRRAFRVVAVGLIAGMALVAAGITASPFLEVVAAIAFAASIIGLVGLQVRYVAPRTQRRLPQALFIVSALAGVTAMLAAVAYAWSEYTQRAFILIPQMLQIHGAVNALGFVLCNLLAWTLYDRINL